MRRIPAILAASALILVTSACGSSVGVTDYLSLPFSSEARITIDSSEYLVHIDKGGADLVSVTVAYPEAFRGLTVSLGGESFVEFNGNKIELGFPRTVAELIYDAFQPGYITEIFSDGDVEYVRFASPRGKGSICVDSYSSVPLSIDSEGVIIELKDFQR